MMSSSAPYRILLYYKFVPIADPQALAAVHLAYCKRLGLRGRILIAPEGINGTCSGTPEQTTAYQNLMEQIPLFRGMVYKVDESEQHAFEKIFVRAKKELVTFRLEDDVDPNQSTGKRLKPKQFFEKLQDPEVIVIDGRNAYEYDIGHFRGAIRPNLESSREFPQWIRENLHAYKNKPIITYCTGGIRCEKLSGFLLKEGFTDVSQLDGGIVTYGKDPEVQGRLFDGKCYVFDKRVSVKVNHTDEDCIVGKCHHCGKAEDRYVNCANDYCHLQHICCPACEEEHQRFCSPACEEITLKRLEA